MPKTKFKLSAPLPHQQYLHVELNISTSNKQTEIHLPTWRPGRYELGNFAKNIRAFKVFDQENNPLSFQKKSKHCWLVDSANTKELRIQYQYYSAELNAGSTFVDTEQLYVNPVNCLLYTTEQFNNPIQIDFEIPNNWLVASSMELIKNKSFQVNSFDELFDSPVICSPNLVEKTYKWMTINFMYGSMTY